MKNKMGFNLFFALIAFIMLMGLRSQYDFETNTFRNTALGILNLAVFIASVYFTFKKKAKTE